MFPFHARFQGAIYGLQKIVAMGLNVKTDEICSQEPVEQLALPRTDTECLRIRPGNVPEDGYAGIRPLLFDQFRQQCKVIILDEQRRLLCACHLLQHCLGKLPVRLYIVLPIERPEQRPRVSDMAKRPQAFVGEAVVVALFFFLVEPYSPQRVLWLVGWDGQPVILVNGLAVGIPAAMSDPGAVTGLQNRLQCGDQSAGRYQNLERLALPGMHVRFAVGNYKQPVAIELAAHVHCQSLRRPGGFPGFSQPRFFFRRLPRRGQTLHQRGHFIP